MQSLQQTFYRYKLTLHFINYMKCGSWTWQGLLLNIGFLESLKLTAGRWDCFIFHDVDLIPEDGRNYYTCPPRTRPRHMSSLVSSLDYKLPYDEIFGGGIYVFVKSTIIFVGVTKNFLSKPGGTRNGKFVIVASLEKIAC